MSLQASNLSAFVLHTFFPSEGLFCDGVFHLQNCSQIVERLLRGGKAEIFVLLQSLHVYLAFLNSYKWSCLIQVGLEGNVSSCSHLVSVLKKQLFHNNTWLQLSLSLEQNLFYWWSVQLSLKINFLDIPVLPCSISSFYFIFFWFCFSLGYILILYLHVDHKYLLISECLFSSLRLLFVFAFIYVLLVGIGMPFNHVVCIAEDLFTYLSVSI